MKVFLGWSGRESHQVACIFRDWLPLVIQSLEPFISSDIEKGERWSVDIAEELEATSFGILCVTRENLASPWLHFEAGALSKTMTTSRVAPFLFRLKHSEIPGRNPFVQFQSTAFEREDVLRLITTLNTTLEESNRLDQNRLAQTFSAWWPDLEKKLSALPEITPTLVEPAQTREESILEELLELARSQQRLMTSPDKAEQREPATPDRASLPATERIAEAAFVHWLTAKYPLDRLIHNPESGVDFVLGTIPEATGFEVGYARSRRVALPSFEEAAQKLGEMVTNGILKNAYVVLITDTPRMAHDLMDSGMQKHPRVGVIVGVLRKDGVFGEVMREEAAGEK